MGPDEETMRAARAAAESLMTDQCVIRRPTGGFTTDPHTHEDVPEFEVVYDPRDKPNYGKCKVQTYEAFEQERESAGLTQIINRVRVDVPVGAANLLPNDVVTMLASADPLMVGRHYRLTVQAPYKTHATAYRVFAEINVGMEVPPWQ